MPVNQESVIPSFWPHRDASRWVESGGLRWHVQTFGHGDPIVLLHGTGASGHSWASVATHLATHYRVVIPDLPGQGFSELPRASDCSLQHYAQQVDQLLHTLNLLPATIVGHSAGAAIGLQCGIDLPKRYDHIICVNGAFRPFGGAAYGLFSRCAQWLSRTGLLPWLISKRQLSERQIQKALGDTGSQLCGESVRCYQHLLQNRQHIQGALQMMAGWRLDTLGAQLSRIEASVSLITASGDRTVAPHQSDWAAERIASASRTSIPGLGHLAHEEDPTQVAQLIADLKQMRR